MSYRTTLVLLCLCAFATAYVHFSERFRRPAWEVGRDRVFDVQYEGVTGLTIEKGGEPIVLRRTAADHWSLEQPLRYPALYALAEHLTYSIIDLRSRGEGDAAEPGRYGFRETALAATLDTRAGGEIRVEFGMDHPREPFVYARTRDLAGAERVVLCEPRVRNAFRDVAVSDLRAVAISAIDSGRAAAIAIRSGGGEVRMTLENATWRITSDPPGDADAARVRALLDRLNSWMAEEFVTDDPVADLAAYGLLAPRARVEILARRETSTKTPARVAIEIGGDGPAGENGERRVYLRHEGQPHVLLAAAAPLRSLERGADDFRSRALFGSRADPPRMLAFEATTDAGGAAETGSVEQESGGKWKYVVAGVRQPVEDAFVGALADNLANTALIESFLAADRDNLQRYGFDVPRLRLTMAWPDGGKESVLVGGEVTERAGLWYVWNEEWRYFAAARLGGMRALFELPWSLRARKVVELPEDRIRDLVLASGDGAERHVVRPHDTWKDAAGGAPLDQEAQTVLARLCRQLAALEAAKWESAGENAPGPGEAFFLRVQIKPIDGEFDARDIYFGPALPGRERLARDGPGGWVFRLRQDPRGADPFEVARSWLDRGR